MLKKIAFIELSSFSNINDSVRNLLKREFPEYEVEVINIFKEVKRNKILYLLNILFILIEYFPDILKGKKTIKECFTRNSFMFHLIQYIVRKRIKEDGFSFSIQTQSVFDASTGKIPHFVYTDHTMLANLNYNGFNKNKLPSANWLKLEKQIYTNAKKIFTMSNHVTNSLIEKYSVDPQKIEKVFAGSNIHMNGLMTQKRNYADKNILFVGGNWERKGGPVLIEAFKRISDYHPDAKLTIVSRQAPELNIPNCTIYGKLELSEVAARYSNTSIFCLPTRLEPFGIVFLEAMMYSLPVVATNIGAIPDFIKHEENGLLVEPDNVEELVTALKRLLDNPELSKSYGKKGFSIYEQNYTWEQVGIKIKNQIETELIMSKKFPAKDIVPHTHSLKSSAVRSS